MRFEHRFVENIPETLDSNVLYIALDCGAVVHLCACGCGNQAVTPLGRTDWSITYDGETISLWPSVGNWSFQCQSHYFIKKDEVRWAEKWSHKQIADGRRLDRALKDGASVAPESGEIRTSQNKTKAPTSWLSRAINWITK